MSLLVGFPVEAERLLAIRSIGHDRLGATVVQPLPQLGAVIGGIAEQLVGRLGASDQALGRWTIVCLAAGQEEGKKAALSICECVDLRVAPAARAANRLSLRRPFRPPPSGAP